MPRIMTAVQMQVRGLSPFEKYAWCSHCREWIFGKPLYCPDCHKRCRNRKHSSEAAVQRKREKRKLGIIC